MLHKLERPRRVMVTITRGQLSQRTSLLRAFHVARTEATRSHSSMRKLSHHQQGQALSACEEPPTHSETAISERPTEIPIVETCSISSLPSVSGSSHTHKPASCPSKGLEVETSPGPAPAPAPSALLARPGCGPHSTHTLLTSGRPRVPCCECDTMP